MALIVLSLVLLSTHFSESSSGPLHTLQKGVSAALSPIEEGASRALKPARDLVNWVDETFDARGENERLRDEIAELRGELAENQSAIGENEQLRGLVDLKRSGTIDAFEPIGTRVIARSPTVWHSAVTVDKGSSAGVEVNDPVVSPDGLVGRVSEVTGGTALVSLITDASSAVSARVLPEGPSGVIEPEVGDPDDLLLDFIENDDEIQEGQILVTAGWSNADVSSAYPYGIEIGRVTDAELGEQESYQRVHVRPFADLRDLDLLQILTGGPERPGVPG